MPLWQWDNWLKQRRSGRTDDMADLGASAKVSGKIPKRALQFIGVKRVSGGYYLYDNKSGQLLASLSIIESTNDMLNSHLRDVVISTYYEYGKVLGIYN